MTSLLDRIARELGTDIDQARRVLDVVGRAVRDELRDGSGVVDIPCVGRLAYRQDPGHDATNPFTREHIRVPGVGRLKVRLDEQLSNAQARRRGP